MGEINDSKNQRQEIMLANDEVNFEEGEEWGNEYRDTVTRYGISMDEIESKLRSFKEIEKQNTTEQEKRRMERTMMEMQLHMKKKEEDKIRLKCFES